MPWYHLILAASVALVTYTTLRLTGFDRVAWADPKRRLAYIAILAIGIALSANSMVGESSMPLSAMAVGWAVGVGVAAAQNWLMPQRDKPVPGQ